MKMIVLAAGRGERLYPLTKNTPKPLLDLGDGTTILEKQLETVRKIPEIKEVILAIGYRAEQIEAKIKMHKEDGMKIKTVLNPFYDVSNNLMTLWMARHEMDSDFIITNGDNIFEAEAMKKLVQTEKPGIYLAIVRKERYDEDDMKVVVGDDSCVMRVSKQIPVAEANADSVGLVKVQGERHRRLFLETMEELARNPEYRNKFWLEIFNRLSDKGFPVTTVEIDRSHWKEIDFHPDIQNIRNMVGLAGK
jgi:choline kinase